MSSSSPNPSAVPGPSNRSNRTISAAPKLPGRPHREVVRIVNASENAGKILFPLFFKPSKKITHDDIKAGKEAEEKAEAEEKEAAEAEEKAKEKEAAAAKKEKERVLSVKEAKNKLDSIELSERIKCVEYSIKRLELDLRLTNEDSIGTTEFNNLIHELKELSGELSIDACFKSISISDFEANARMKRNMNSYSAIIKLASFICPMLAMANKYSLLKLAQVASINEDDIKKTTNICNTMLMTMMNMASIETGEMLEGVSGALDTIDKAQDAGVIDAIYNAVGITALAGSTIGSTIGETIEKIYENYIETDKFIKIFLKIASKPQRIIATASLILFIMFTLLNVVEGNYTVLLEKIDESGRFEEVLGGAKKIKYKSKSTKPAKTPKALAKPAKTPKALAKLAKTPKVAQKKKK